jgi:hypothetical protein
MLQSVEDVEKMSLAEIRHLRSVVEGDEQRRYPVSRRSLRKPAFPHRF